MGKAFREKRRREIRHRIVQAIKDLGAEKQRPPRLRELSDRMGYAHYSTLGYHLGHMGNGGTSYTRVFDDAYREAGYERRKPGSDLGSRKSRMPGTIGSRLTQKRLELRLTQAEISEQMGVAKNTIGFHELNRSMPGNRILNEYSQFYNVPVRWILTGNGEDPVS